MNSVQPGLSRRRFIQQSTLSAASLLGSNLGLMQRVYASQQADSALLPFRRDADILALHFNENSLGMSPRALQAAKVAIEKKGNRYVDDLGEELRVTLASLHKVEKDQVLLGNGSTEIIGAVVMLAASLQATIIEPSPTFGDLRNRAKAYNLPLVRVPVTDAFVTNIAALREAAEQTSGNVVVNLCNPNNPTGTIADKTALLEWVRQAPPEVIFLLDEAYYDYAFKDPGYLSGITLVAKGQDNLIVTRTFSKIYGMAGMRIGYGVASQTLAKQLAPFNTSWNLSAAGAAAAIASLQDESFYQFSFNQNKQAKALLTQTLTSLQLPFVPSHTNFVLHRINSDLGPYQQRMLANHVKVGRKMTQADNWNRISLGTVAEMEQFCLTLMAFRERGWV